MDDRVVVLGGGIVGLTAAWRLVESGWYVEVWSDRDWAETTSAVAAAVWRPYRAEPEADVVRWSTRTFQVYEELAEVRDSGVIMMSGLELGREPMADPAWAQALPGFGHAAAAALPDGYVDALAYRVPVVAMNLHLPWLVAELTARGVRFVRRRVGWVEEALVATPRVVNATGLGARDLVPDLEVYPVRGQVLRLTNPGLTEFRLDYHHPAGLTYVVPRGADVIIGGTDQEDSWDTAVDEPEAAAILERCCQLCPELARAEVLGRAVGLRPARSSVRLELVDAPGGWVCHSYGHGGAGVTTAWGCADDTAALIGETRP
ncbi:FAD-dependent oxidoreductase [Nocardioides sp. LHG3406-4]|uniref:FAD-dependent oxidoreductase n=1 Tax=Nocardioides sp. LHG3406-4 TaxID=2804575 RepID=UPI003CEED481